MRRSFFIKTLKGDWRLKLEGKDRKLVLFDTDLKEFLVLKILMKTSFMLFLSLGLVIFIFHYWEMRNGSFLEKSNKCLFCLKGG